ncbi:Hypothetical predicted protein [Marmota monax]|uniref:UPAR/Ly6 domain-containing protein n=2 Tax=Marmota monax TaxID=9995 RepID=A0A5E4AC45_MARMO|nr:Hypothetical predicted protein [Marmota monax]
MPPAPSQVPGTPSFPLASPPSHCSTHKQLRTPWPTSSNRPAAPNWAHSLRLNHQHQADLDPQLATPPSLTKSVSESSPRRPLICLSWGPESLLCSAQVPCRAPMPSVLGTLQCPVCFSRYNCPEKASQQFCPVGQTHCYNGVLKLRGGGIATNLKVQGCLPKPGCDLLNGTQKIGPIAVSENCNPKSGAQALECKWGAIEAVRNVSELPLQWTTGWESCAQGQGCQETVILVVNGPLVNVVLTKGCTEAEDQEGRVSEHRKGPGLTIISYTRVCRHKDFCNDLSSTDAFWTPPPAAVLGTLQCPVCFSRYNCPEKASQQFCPVGQTHCYNGVLKLRGGGIATNLKVQGCLPKPGCDLLNGTQKIGPIAVSENCNPKSGPLVNVVLTKGCTEAEDQEGRVSEHRKGPGLTIISYTRVCRHKDFCNDLSSTDAFWTPPPAAVLGTLQCPVCFSRYNCPEKASQQFCPVGQTHCYNGVLKLRGGGIATNLKVQGCLPKPGCDLLNGTQKIGPIAVSENCNPKSGPLVNVVLTKGCTEAEDQEGRVSEHRKGPGLTIISYTRVCRHKDFCNDLSSTDAFWTPPPAAGVRGGWELRRRGKGLSGARSTGLRADLSTQGEAGICRLPFAGSLPRMPPAPSQVPGSPSFPLASPPSHCSTHKQLRTPWPTSSNSPAAPNWAHSLRLNHQHQADLDPQLVR